MIDVRIANEQDAIYISNNMRVADQDEFYKVTGDHDAIKSIMLGIQAKNSITYCFLSNGIPMAIAGIIDKQDFKIVWACGTDEVTKNGRSFIVETKRLLKKHHSDFKPYLNYVDCENKNAIRYLKHVGFVINDPIPYGKLGCKFHPFIWGS